jgi:hypothetical protein
MFVWELLAAVKILSNPFSMEEKMSIKVGPTKLSMVFIPNLATVQTLTMACLNHEVRII